MAETKRYEVGPEQGYRSPTVLKLTEDQAKAMGATKVSKVTTTADDLTKRDRYEEAITRQDEMRAREAALVEETTKASSKKRAAPEAE